MAKIYTYVFKFLGFRGTGNDINLSWSKPNLGLTLIDDTQCNEIRRVLNSYSHAECIEWSKSTRRIFPIPVPIAPSNTDVRAEIHYRDTETATEYYFQLSAPIDNMFEEDSQGDRVKRSVLDDLENTFNTAVGTPNRFIFLWGKKLQKG